MLELCSGLQPCRCRLAFDTGAIAGFRSGIDALGCAVTAFGLLGSPRSGKRLPQFGFTMSALLSRVGNRESWKIGACQIASGSYLESTLAKNRGRGAATLTSPLRARPDLSLAESYRCTQNKHNSFRMLFLQKKVGGTPSLK